MDARNLRHMHGMTQADWRAQHNACKAGERRLPEAGCQALVVLQAGVEWVPDVVDAERRQLHDPVDQEADAVHQVRLERRVWQLLVLLHNGGRIVGEGDNCGQQIAMGLVWQTLVSMRTAQEVWCCRTSCIRITTEVQ